MENQVARTPSFKWIWILLPVVAVFLALIFIWNMTSNDDYIDGNVLNLPYMNLWNEDDLIDSPWKNIQFFNTLMFRSLFLADSTFTEFNPDLATSYEILDDGLVYQIVLRDDLFWSDGEAITPDDVVFSIKAVLVSNEVNAAYVSAFQQIVGAQEYMRGETTEIEGIAVEGNLITLTLRNAYPSMLNMLSQFAILPEHCLGDSDWVNILKDDYWKDPIVSGRYEVGEVVPNETVTLVKNPYYVGEQSDIEEIMLHVDYKFTNLDYYSTNNITEIINYRSMRYMNEYKIDILFYRYLMFNIEGTDGNYNEAMDDFYFRQAVAYAIDREQLLYDIYLDSGTLIDSGVQRTSTASDGVTIEYNVELAKELLALSNYDLSRPLRLTYYYQDTISHTFMEEVAADLEAIGLTVELFQCDSSMLYDERAYDICLKGLSAFDENEWYIEYSSTSTQASSLFGGSTVFEDLVSELCSEVDEEKKNELLLELQQLEHETLYKIPMFTLGQVVYINEDRVDLPDDCTFGNTWYKYDVNFEDWKIKKE